MDDNGGNWNQWSKHIRLELERQAAMDDKHREEAEKCKKEVATLIDDLRDRVTKLEVSLRYKGVTWGAVAGAIPGIVAIILMLVVWIITHK